MPNIATLQTLVPFLTIYLVHPQLKVLGYFSFLTWFITDNKFLPIRIYLISSISKQIINNVCPETFEQRRNFLNGRIKRDLLMSVSKAIISTKRRFPRRYSFQSEKRDTRLVIQQPRLPTNLNRLRETEIIMARVDNRSTSEKVFVPLYTKKTKQAEKRLPSHWWRPLRSGSIIDVDLSPNFAARSLLNKHLDFIKVPFEDLHVLSKYFFRLLGLFPMQKETLCMTVFYRNLYFHSLWFVHW